MAESYPVGADDPDFLTREEALEEQADQYDPQRKQDIAHRLIPVFPRNGGIRSDLG